jgi:hypothetical protein
LKYQTLITVFCINLLMPLHAFQDARIGADEYDISLFDSIENFEENFSLDDFFNALPTFHLPTRQIDVKTILGLLNSIGAFSLLEQDFYRRTNPFAQRTLLDLPLWEIHECQEPRHWIVGFDIFWNHLHRSVFCDWSTNIKSYLDLEQETIFQALDEITPQIRALFPNAALIDNILNTTRVQQLLTLFENFTVQQRRLGFMFHAWRQWQRAEIRMLWPLYYLERNLFVEPDEQAAIENQFGALDPIAAHQFEANHAISDTFGFGDFRLEVDYAAYVSDGFALRAGAFCTLPISFALVKGIRGTTFNQQAGQPTFSLQSLFDLIPADFNFDSITAEDLQTARQIVIGDICKNKNGFFLGALDRLNAVLLESSLGNYRHIGIGLFLRSRTALSTLLEEYEWAYHISLNNRISVEYVTPAREPRFFIKRNTPDEFSARNFNTNDPQEQLDNLTFIETELVDKFYPFAITTTVQPGVIIHWMSRWCFSGEIWDISIGSDVWVQTHEKLKSLHCADATLRAKLDLDHAANGLVYQVKSFAGFGIKINRPTYDALIGINAEGTSWAKGIGKDITAAINIEFNF